MRTDGPWCPICGGGTTRKALEMYDDRYGYPGRFPAHRCSECHHLSLSPSFSDEQLSTLYSTYYPRSAFSLEQHRPHEERSGFLAWLDGACSSAFRWVPRSVRVLDIGCGFGEALGYHQRRDCEAFGVETDKNIRRVAERFGYKVHVGVFDPNAYEAASFDYVTMDQVMEHVQDPLAVLRGIAQVLKPGGKAILSVPNAHGWGARVFGRRWINWHVPYHMQFYSVQSMQRALAEAGLALERTDTVTSSSWLSYQWLHLLTYPSEGEVSRFWSPEGRYGFAEKVVIKVLRVVHLAKLNHFLTRLFDAVGLGDNRLFFVRKP